MAAISAGLALTAGAVAPVAARADAAGSTKVASTTTTATVRLLTGDSVTVGASADGKQVASVEPGPGRKRILFRTFEHDGHLTVLPSDAGDLVASGRLDRGLFDVTALVAQHYDTAHTRALPLIVSRPAGVEAAAVSRLTAFAADKSPVRRLKSIGAQSVRVADGDLGAFWKEITGADDSRTTATELKTVPRVWLDGRVNAVLDRSTAQIGAPAVWDAGYHGEGVKVAVLDTGVDQTHPDLAGRIAEAQDFSGSTGTNDVFGHGTHVASIVGGTGAASGGTRKGVAPAAQLLVGKVLGDDGFGSESQVIAGMEWATEQGAKVVNMSLGSDQATDGTDPMSLAVNELSDRTGALFVVAAGNSGEQGAGTVGSPGAADSALTVGAVDRDDSLAPFSSRGPRVGDGAVKPDVTAPGVGIVAARAAGTTMGDPVDANYVAASGTSMATPHVAGAAALLAQRHPDWTGSRLKDALTSTAHTMPGQEVSEQGGGRIDLPAAVLGSVTATGGVTPGDLRDRLRQRPYASPSLHEQLRRRGHSRAERPPGDRGRDDSGRGGGAARLRIRPASGAQHGRGSRRRRSGKGPAGQVLRLRDRRVLRREGRRSHHTQPRRARSDAPDHGQDVRQGRPARSGAADHLGRRRIRRLHGS
ncbi:S8 family peptidase [Streptomyces sp. NBC_00197]|uniref:S8 family peptidase n=1 Tax=Streptomyces sp. NBC_00197 TaxID=2975676 RepID=UPI00324D78BE